MKSALESPDSSLVRNATEDPAQSPPEFSLVLGGPLFQLCRRIHLAGDALELSHRQALLITVIAWLPLLFFSVFERHAMGGAINIPFLHDIEANVRFLAALPVLIMAELVVHRRISPLVRRFREGSIVATEDLRQLNAAVNSALRARDSVAVEGTLLAVVYVLGLWLWRSRVALVEPTWYAIPEAKQLQLTLAGYWYAFVSIPIFQFILLRWYSRLVIWFRLLWQISRLNLHLSAAHPDRACGIGFVGKSSYAFAPLLFAQGTLLSGLIANRVLYEGKNLLSFKMEAAGFVGFFVLIILGPLVMFTPQLLYARRKSSAEYGLLANRHVFGFENGWLRGCDLVTGKPAATADLQSIAVVTNVYSNVRQTRLVPFGSDDIARLAIITAAPLLPLALTIYSVPELIKFLVKLLFH